MAQSNIMGMNLGLSPGSSLGQVWSVLYQPRCSFPCHVQATVHSGLLATLHTFLHLTSGPLHMILPLPRKLSLSYP